MLVKSIEQKDEEIYERTQEKKIIEAIEIHVKVFEYVLFE